MAYGFEFFAPLRGLGSPQVTAEAVSGSMGPGALPPALEGGLGLDALVNQHREDVLTERAGLVPVAELRGAVAGSRFASLPVGWATTSWSAGCASTVHGARSARERAANDADRLPKAAPVGSSGAAWSNGLRVLVGVAKSGSERVASDADRPPEAVHARRSLGCDGRLGLWQDFEGQEEGSRRGTGAHQEVSGLLRESSLAKVRHTVPPGKHPPGLCVRSCAGGTSDGRCQEGLVGSAAAGNGLWVVKLSRF